MSTTSSSSGASAGRGRGRGRRGVPLANPSDRKPGGGSEEEEEAPPLKDSPPSSPKRQDDLDKLGKTAQGLSISREMARRPDYGTVGREVGIQVNYYKISVGSKGESLVVQRYQIEFVNTSMKLDKDDKRILFWECIRRHPETFPNKYSLAFDDSAACYSVSKLKFPGSKDTKATTKLRLEANRGNFQHVFSFEFQLDFDKKPFTYNVQFQFTSQHIVDLTQSANPDHGDRQMDPVQIVDLIVNQGKKCPLLEASKSWYPFGKGVYKLGVGTVDLGAGRELWTGYKAAAKIGQNRLTLLNVDVSNTAFFKKQSFLNLMCDLLEESLGNRERKMGNRGQGQTQRTYQVSQLNAETNLEQREYHMLREGLRKCGPLRLKSNHMTHDRGYKYHDLADTANNIRFDTDNGRVTVAQYFMTKYERALKYPNLPCVQVKPQQKGIVIPMEYLEVFTPQKFPSKKLTEFQVATMIRHSARPADERKRIVDQLVRELGPGNDPFFKEFGVDLKLDMLSGAARILPEQTMRYSDEVSSKVKDGVWEQGPGVKFLHPASFANYGVIAFLDYRRHGDTLVKFCINQMQTCKILGMTVPPGLPKYMKYVRDSREIGDVLEQIKYQEGKEEKQGGKQPINLVVFVVMRNKDPSIYSEIKRFGDVELGVMTQCILLKNVEKISSTQPGPRAATAANVAMKLNMKLGGINTSLGVEKGLQEEHTLFLGVDVTHPGAADTHSPSIGCVVGNVNLEATKWGASVKIQSHRREHMVYMQDEAKQRIVQFYDTTGMKPGRVIVYRDGVSEGQFTDVLREEMLGIRSACTGLSADYRPPITFIVVQKRHHTRLFMKDFSRASGRARNVIPGTVLDKGITHPTEFDFFLCSHQGIQGTSRPTHYHVLHDESGSSADEIQMTTYQLCHLFGRCNRVVSIPAPVYFADLCCTRARYHVRARRGGSSEGASRGAGRSKGGSGSSGEEDDTKSAMSDGELKEAVKAHKDFLDVMYFA